MEICRDPEVLKVILYIKTLIDIILYIIPIILIVMMGLDIFKSIAASKEDEMKKNINISIKRIVFIVIMFLVPTIVKFSMSILGDIGVDYTECYNNANSDTIEDIAISNTNIAYQELLNNPTRENLINAQDSVSKISDKDTRNTYNEKINEIEEQIIELEKEQINNNEKKTPSKKYSPSESTSGTNSNNSNTNSSSGVVTGYLTSPLNQRATNAEFKQSIGSNSQTIYYLSGSYHGGTDLPVEIGTNVYAMDGGTVYKVQDSCGAYGRHIILQHIVDQKEYFTIYAHLDSIETKYLTIGTPVNQGDKIAESGNTYHCGETVGAHLHIGISYNSGGAFPQTEGDASFLVGNFIGTLTKYSIVDNSNLAYYKEQHY